MPKIPIFERKRIERAKALVGKLTIGVDPASRRHTAIVYSPERLPLSAALSVQNDRQGFEAMEKTLNHIRSQYPSHQAVFVIEASGEYWKPMWHYFSQRDYQFVLVPPLFVKRTRDLDDHTPRSNDPKDAVRITNLALEGRYFVPPPQPEIFEDLQQAVRAWEKVTDDLIRSRLRIGSLLAKYFPEYPPLFSNLIGATSLAVLELCPFPADVLSANKETLCQTISNASGKKIEVARVDKLCHKAAESIGVTRGIAGARLRLKVLLQDANKSKEQAAMLRRELRQMQKKIDYAKRIQSICGIGLISTARFLGHLGDMNNFDKVKKIIDLAGISLIATESGNFYSSRQISRRGRAGLRCILYEMTCHFVRFPNSARRKYLASRLQGKLYRQAIVAAIPHLVRTIFAVVNSDSPYQHPAVNDPLRQQIATLEKQRQEQQKKNKKAA